MSPSVLVPEFRSGSPSQPTTPSSTNSTGTPTTTSLTEKAILHSLPNKLASSSYAELDATSFIFTPTSNPKPVPANWTDPLLQGHDTYCTDHMVTVSWRDGSGWQAPRITQYGPLSIMPTASVLHYSTECFEGLKVYRGMDDKLRLFRPSLNCARMLMSSTRISCPSFPPEQLLQLIKQFCAIEGKKWLPNKMDTLYLRPTMIANHPQLGVKKPGEALLFIIMSYLPVLSSRPIKILGSKDDACRAWPGGFGFAKVGANYGPTLMATAEAKREGYDQILWLFGKEGYVTEAGASNLFVLWRQKKEDGGKLELITAPLTDKIILDGVTRRSVLGLARSRLTARSSWTQELGLEPITVTERKFTASEIVNAYEDGRLVESFTCGTAYFVTAIEKMHLRGKDIIVPTRPVEQNCGLEQYGSALKTWLVEIMYGAAADGALDEETSQWGVVIQEE